MNVKLPELGNSLGDAVIAGLIFAGLTVIAYWVARFLLKRLLKGLASRTTTTLDDKVITASVKPLGMLIIFVGLYYVVGAFSEFLPEYIERQFDGILYVVVVFFVTSWVMKLVETFFDWYAQTVASRTESSTDDEFIPLIVRVSKIVLGAIAIIIVLKHFNQDVQSLVVSLGVGSLAIALAAQETLSNMIAGFVIMTDRPFRVGDRIELSDGKVGDVYQVGLRSTKLMTFDNTLVIVPNSEIVKERVINRSYPDPIIRIRIDVGVAYSSDVDQVKQVLVDIFKEHPAIMDDPEPKAYFLNFGDSSLDFMVQGRVEDWKLQFSTADELRSEIHRRFKREGIEIPFPQRDLWVRALPAAEKDADSTNNSD